MQILPCAVYLLYYAKVQILTREELYLSAAVAALFWHMSAYVSIRQHTSAYGLYLSAAVAALFWPSIAPPVLDLRALLVHPYKY